MGTVAILFNPIIPVGLGRDIWLVVDAIAASLPKLAIPCCPPLPEVMSMWLPIIAIIAIGPVLYIGLMVYGPFQTTVCWRGTTRAHANTSASARSGEDCPRFLASSLLSISTRPAAVCR